MPEFDYRVTVIKPDSCVVVDGNAQFGVDLSFLAANIRVVQWYRTTGEVEYSDGTQNLIINDFTPYMQAYNNWNTAYQANTDRPDTYYLKSDWKQSRKYKLSETPNLTLYTTLIPIPNEQYQKFEEGIWVVDTVAKTEAERVAFNNNIYGQIAQKNASQQNALRRYVLGINVPDNQWILDNIDAEIDVLEGQIIPPPEGD